MANDNIEWTSEQMIENANNWSLAGDVAILNRLKKFSETFLSGTETLNTKVDDMLNRLEYVTLKLDLTKNEFQSLKNTQFIENRVYEDDETLESDNEKKEEEKELSEEDKEEIIRRSIARGLEVMKKYYDKVELAVSDSEGESNDKSYILQPKDPYMDRPLPYLVGSEEWYKKWHVGLLPSDSESESEREEEAYSSSSDSEKYLPKNRVMGSETSSELDFINRSTGPVANSTFNDSQDPRRQVFHSSDDSSEQSSSLPVKTPLSNEKFAEQLAAKLGDVISSKNEASENVTPGRITQPPKYGNLFADEPPLLNDSEDTILPKSAQQDLFSGGRDLFSENSSEDLFWNSGQGNTGRGEVSPTFQKPNPNIQQPPSSQSKPKTSKGLFDETDSSSEEDMLTVTEKRKIMSSKITNPYMQPYKTTVPFIDDQPPEIMRKVESGTSKKKPIGGVSVFGKDNDIFAAKTKITEQEAEKVSVTPLPTQDSKNRVSAAKKVTKKLSLFDESSDEEIFVPKTKNSEQNAPEKLPSEGNKKLSLFEDSDEFPTEEASTGTKKQSFSSDQTNKEKPAEQQENSKKVGLFDDDLEQNLFSPTTKEIPEKKNEVTTEPRKATKKISLFNDDDDDDFLKEEEDIFSVMPKKKSLFDDLEDKPSKNLTRSGLFGDLEGADDLNSNKSSKGPLQNILGGLDTGTTESKSHMKKNETPIQKVKVVKKPTSLFEESEGSDADDLSVQSMSKQSNLQDNKESSKISEDSTISGTFLDAEKLEKSSEKHESLKEEKDDSSLNFKEDNEDQPVTAGKDEDLQPNTSNIQQNFAQPVRTNENIKNNLEKSPVNENESGFLSKIRKNVSLFGSESEQSSEEKDLHGKKNQDPEKYVVSPHEDLMKDNVLSVTETQPIYCIPSDEKMPVPESETKSAGKVPDNEPSQEFSMPPPLNLFDPTPPPVDWDASSDNSVESDRFSLTDGILERTNYNQSQPTPSSLFDEAPPSLDVNDINYSSGIVKDINATRLENDDSSFYPHASSSRRLSSDIFNDQQSQDSFFVTKNPSESQMHASNLEKIPEKSENVMSKIENLTPSGNAEDFDGSGSVFEKTDENASVNDMDKTKSALHTNSNVLQKVSLFGADSRSDVDDGGGKRSDISPVKTSPGKLKNTLNINVGALLPGAAPPRTRTSVIKSSSLDETDKSFIIPEIEVNSGPTPINRLIKQKSETFTSTQKTAGDPNGSGHFENLSGTEVLHSVTKDRARIQVKRRPSTRKARLEAVRKSLVEPDISQSSEQPTVYEEIPGVKNVDREAISNKTDQKYKNDSMGKKFPTSSDTTPEIQGISLVFDKSVQENIKKMPKSEVEADLFHDISPEGRSLFENVIEKNKPLSAFGSSLGGSSNDINDTTKSIPKETDSVSKKPQTSSLFDDSFEDNDNLFKPVTKSSSATSGVATKIDDTYSSSNAFKDVQKPSTKADLFGAADALGSSDEDLFFRASKLSNKQVKTEEKPTPRPTKSSLFSDNSGSDSDSDLFGGKSKHVASKPVKSKPPEAAKKTSIFDDFGESSDEDLFGSTVKSNRASSTGNTGASQGSRRVETKSVVKKLENKKITDSDPLSGFK